QYGLRSTKEVLDEHFDDQRVKSALGVYWTYLGQPPSKLRFDDMALLLFGYLEAKPWHVVGGSQAMSAAILGAFKRAGGTVMFNTAVDKILTAHGAVAGVQLDSGQEVTASDVVSNISLPVTYGMLDSAAVPTAVSADLQSRRIGVSGFVLYMGLDASAADLGLTTASTFINTDLDDDHTYAAMSTLAPARGTIITCYENPSIGFSPAGGTHATLMTLQYGSLWEKMRAADYARTKFGYAQTLLDHVEHIAPNIRDAIEEIDVATPLTMTRYLGHPGGAIYGYDQDATENWPFRNSERQTHIPGLHLAGSWPGMGGFQPTLEAGVRVARRLMRGKSTKAA
ncbi:MAG TPA: FAD-dependent oxidoreductase, partial [Mycobacterium sp.]|nr:FAD-dependent oxidoreductase [Mycobacterium sp.]